MQSNGHEIVKDDRHNGITIFGYRNEASDLKYIIWHRYNGLPAFLSNNEYSFHWDHDNHRYNGPASVQSINGESPYREWCLFGEEIDPFDYFDFLDRSSIDINNIGEADKLLIALEFNYEYN